MTPSCISLDMQNPSPSRPPTSLVACYRTGERRDAIFSHFVTNLPALRQVVWVNVKSLPAPCGLPTKRPAIHAMQIMYPGEPGASSPCRHRTCFRPSAAGEQCSPDRVSAGSVSFISAPYVLPSKRPAIHAVHHVWTLSHQIASATDERRQVHGDYHASSIICKCA
jgi:hypothetical protein